MPVVEARDAPNFGQDGLEVQGLAAPSRGATETSVWRLRLAPRTPGVAHMVDREEIFVALAGTAFVTLHGKSQALVEGDALIVPANEQFSLANDGDVPFEAVCVLPVGGRARFPGGEPFVPPWAE